jgi:tetratricopeptide (TPR) repeat protein
VTFARPRASLYNAIISAQPDHVEALHRLGVLEAQRGRLDEGYRLISRALRIEPGSALAHFHAAIVLYGLKRLEEALSSYDRALALKPDYAEALVMDRVLAELAHWRQDSPRNMEAPRS